MTFLWKNTFSRVFSKTPVIFSTLTLIVSISACSSPSASFHNAAIAEQFNVSYLNTDFFQHTIYSNNAILKSTNKTLHIYLDGDGTPWLNRYRRAKDPTSRKKMILTLMNIDQAPAILLGRPCYYGQHTSLNCHPRYWTSHRYAPKIVQSMQQALSIWLTQHPQVQNITFIGYSGGGALAVLLAAHFKQIRQVVTVAANLDISQWTKQHTYTPLTGSLNPIMQAKLPANIKQVHIAGALDKNMPVAIIKNYAATKGPAEVIIFDNQTHCCWDKHWLAILAIINTHSP